MGKKGKRGKRGEGSLNRYSLYYENGIIVV
jgi:hypothetical protein